MEIAHDSGHDANRLPEVVVRIKDALRRRWPVLAIVAALIFALAVGGTFMLTPKYQAIARVRLDPTRNPLANNGQTTADPTLTTEQIDTEVSLVGSPNVARKVVTLLGLLNDPEFTRGMDEATARDPKARAEAVSGAVLNKLSVGRDKLTYILAIRFTSVDPAKAARIANAFAEQYIASKVGSTANTAERQAEFFQKRLDALGREANAADSRAGQYRAQAGITGGQNGTAFSSVVDQQIAPLSGSLATAESDAAEARARLTAARQQIASGGLTSVAEVLNSPVISELRRQRAEVERSVQEVQARYGEKHPESIRVHDQLDAIDHQIRDEASRVVDSLKAASLAADARVASLHGSMSGLEARQAEKTRDASMADSLDREAAAKRAAFDRMSQMSLTSTEGAKNVIAQAEVVEVASPPTKPSFPNKPLFIAIGLILGLAAGAAVIAVQEMLTTGLRTVEEVQSKIGLPVLAAIPLLPRTTSASDMLLDRPTSLFAESLRIARAAILGVRSSKPKHVIAITSALPSEGKTTTALAFARTLATNGARTLLIECDVRRAQIRHMVRTPPAGPGIVEVLHGDATLEQAIHAGDVPNLDQILVKEPYFSSENLFGDGVMVDMLDALRARYDQIVLDLPPLVGLADGRFLAVLADATAIAVKWNATPAAAINSAVEWLRSDGANPVGVIYTMVDSSAEAIGGLYYSKKYSSYYQPA